MQKHIPFHLALGVNDIPKARQFYEDVLGCKVGRVGKDNLWFDISFFGHQVVFHLINKDYHPVDIFNERLNDGVPNPHFGLCLSVEDWNLIKERLQKKNIEFLEEPALYFKDRSDEQYKMFFKDPCGNNIEMKAMTKQEDWFIEKTFS